MSNGNHSPMSPATKKWIQVRLSSPMCWRRAAAGDAAGGRQDYLEPVDWDVGRGHADDYVDSKPYGPLHLRHKLGSFSFTCTSLGLIIQTGE